MIHSPAPHPPLIMILGTALLLIGAVLPGAYSLSTPDREKSFTEGRSLATTPSLPTDLKTLRSWPREFDKAWADQLGFRDELFRIHARTQVALGVSPTQNVIVGTDNWLYFRSPNVPGLVGAELLGATRLEDWHTGASNRVDFLSPLGIPYLMVIEPEKSTVYPQFIPSRYRSRLQTTRIDQVVARAREESRIPLLDLRGRFRTAAIKNPHALYYKTDSHWNLRGADLAQFEIAQVLRDQLVDLEPTLIGDVQTHLLLGDRIPNGDLASMLSLGNSLQEEIVPALNLEPGLCRRLPDALRLTEIGNCLSPAPTCSRREITNPFGLKGAFGLPAARAFEVRCPEAPIDATVLVFRDSYFSEVQPLFSRYFTRTAYVWSAATPSRLQYFTNRIHPAVVIEARVERNILKISNKDEY
jgi:alginate O-acetyltransferase complex protein AlgJ